MDQLASWLFGAENDSLLRAMYPLYLLQRRWISRLTIIMMADYLMVSVWRIVNFPGCGKMDTIFGVVIFAIWWAGKWVRRNHKLSTVDGMDRACNCSGRLKCFFFVATVMKWWPLGISMNSLNLIASKQGYYYNGFATSFAFKDVDINIYNFWKMTFSQ